MALLCCSDCGRSVFLFYQVLCIAPVLHCEMFVVLVAWVLVNVSRQVVQHHFNIPHSCPESGFGSLSPFWSFAQELGILVSPVPKQRRVPQWGVVGQTMR